MFFEEMFNLNENKNNPDDWELSNIINSIKERFYLYQESMNKEIQVEDYFAERLYKCIDFDMNNADWQLKNMFKTLIFNVYYVLNSEGMNENEFIDLKWFILNKLQGYCPSTHQCLYDMEYKR